ncbi:MAG: TerC family protein [Burkholderiales bacterium]|nr:TerC family protein [Burkholderiales bacterium]
MTHAPFWIAVAQIIGVNIILSGDNAVVIAMAARSLPSHQQKKAIFWGSAAAIVLRVILTIIAAEMLKWPYLKLAGGCLLFWIGMSLLAEDDGGGEEGGAGGNGSLMYAVRTILIADLVMSLDNVLAVAAAAKGNTVLLVFGLALSIPLIIFGSTLLMKVMERFPIIVTFGAALLGFLAGEMILTDPALTAYLGGPLSEDWVHIGGAVGAIAVVTAGKLMQRRHAAAAS